MQKLGWKTPILKKFRAKILSHVENLQCLQPPTLPRLLFFSPQHHFLQTLVVSFYPNARAPHNTGSQSVDSSAASLARRKGAYRAT